MGDPTILLTPQSASALRREISARNLQRAPAFAHETTYGSVPSVVYSAGDGNAHGNFFPASYRRIQSKADWARRLKKAYTASGRIARPHDRSRAELDCAASSDALLMNVFCHPSTMRSARLCALLGISSDLLPEFGVRVKTPFAGGLFDRTEMDMRCGDLLVEAKLTESNFQTARGTLLARYGDIVSIFDRDALPQRNGVFLSYQLIRGVLAAVHHDVRFAVFADARRTDLREQFVGTAAAVRFSQVRSRLLWISWQEIAACVPPPLQRFLAEKYGIEAAVSPRR